MQDEVFVQHLLVLTLILVLCTFLHGTSAYAQSASATTSFTVNIPGTILLTDQSTGTNAGAFPTISGTLSGSQLVGTSTDTWNVSSNTAGGALVRVYVSSLSGPEMLQDDVKLSVVNGGGAVPVTPLGAYAAGVALSAIPSTQGTEADLCSTSEPGNGQFVLTLTLDAPMEHGNGTISGIVNLDATTQ